MVKTKLLYPKPFSSDGSLAVVNQLNAMFEDMAHNSGWMELAFVIGFSSGTVIPKGTAVRLTGAQSLPFETGRHDPIAVVQSATESTRSGFIGLTMDEFQAGHFTLARILLWGRLEFSHAFTHGNLVYLSGTTGGLSDTPFQGGEVPIGEWLDASPFAGVHLTPSIVV